MRRSGSDMKGCASGCSCGCGVYRFRLSDGAGLLRLDGADPDGRICGSGVPAVSRAVGLYHLPGAEKRKGMYRGSRIFVFRQMASKVRTMRFAMGTLTLLLICSLMGSAFSLIL